MIIYRTTNLINGKTYIGIDTKDDPKYLGSGIYIRHAIEKYGKENFKKEIVESGFKNFEEISLAEIRLIAEERRLNLNGTYNIANGGLAKWVLTKDPHTRQKISETHKRVGKRPPSRLGSKGGEKQRQAILKTSQLPKTDKFLAVHQERMDKTKRPIICVETGQIFDSLKSAQIALGLSRGNICSVLKGSRKSTKGFSFKYLINEAA